MVTKQQRDHAQDIQSIDRKAASKLWDDKLSAIELIQTLLGDLPSEQTVEHLLEVLGRLAGDSKWEVRKAVVPALLDTGHPAARGIIERLIGDGNQWVRQAAERAKRRLSRITTPADKRDKRVGFAFELIKDLRAGSPEKLYQAALLIGEKYYEELAGDTAHELNTYRAAMECLLSELEQRVAAENGASAEVQEIFAKIKDRSHYLKILVNGLLEYAKDAELDFQIQPLKPMVAEALSLAREKTKAHFADQVVEETVTIPGHLTLEACRPRIVQALTNIFSNAFEALEGKRGGAVLEVVAIRNSSDQLLLKVKDTGCGIDPAEVENAKKRFRSLKKEHGGIGLGLPLAIKIIEREHGGQLDIESELEVGTMVTIELPLSQKGKT